MHKALELQRARVSRIYTEADRVRVLFAHTCIHPRSLPPEQQASSQAAEIVLHQAEIEGARPPLPGTVAEGFIELAGHRSDALPLPYRRKGPATLYLHFADGSEVVIRGVAPSVEILT